MPNWMSIERTRLMQSFGATVIPVSREQGGFLGSIRITEELAAAGGVFLPRQFSNHGNVEGHVQTTGPEIWSQLESAGLRLEFLTPDIELTGISALPAPRAALATT